MHPYGTAVIFVVDGENLQAQAVLLAATLHRHVGHQVKKVAYVPRENAGDIDPLVMDVFRKCGIELRALPVASKGWKTPYPHGNKILACADNRQVAMTFFLDTDMVIMRPPNFASLLKQHPFVAVPEGTPTWGKTGDRWARAYEFFDLPFPSERVNLTRRKRLQFVPYFNAGMFGFSETPIHKGRRFGELWYETAWKFDHEANIGGKRPWLDQITLPLTLKRFGLTYEIADESMNFSISQRDYEGGHQPFIVHYHRWQYLRRWHYYVRSLAALEQICGEELSVKLRNRFDHLWSSTIEIEPVEDKD